MPVLSHQSRASGKATSTEGSDLDRVIEGLGDWMGGDHLGDWPRCGELAMAEQRGVGQTRRQFLEMMGDKDRSTNGPVAKEPAQPGQEVLSGPQIKAGSWFIKEKKVRLSNEHPGQQNPGSLAFGHQTHLGVSQRPDPELGKQVVGPLAINVRILGPPGFKGAVGPGQHGVVDTKRSPQLLGQCG